MKNKFLIAAVVIGVMLLQACGGQSADNDGGGASQPQNTPASTEVPATSAAAPADTAIGPLDPALSAETASHEAISYIYEGLVRLESGEPALALASDITISEDGLDLIFALRPGVTFHDGSPLDADAVMANFNRWYDPQDPLRGSGSYDAWVSSFGGFKGELDAAGKPKSEFDGIEKVNDLTVLIHLSTPDADFLKKLADPAFSIVSPAALQAKGFGTQEGIDGGTGAYEIGSWSDSTLALGPFSDYWNPNAIPTSNMEITLDE